MKLSARGFTLIELLVVISILGLLSTIGLSVFTNAQKKARDVRKKVDVASIAKALEMKFKYDTQKYQKLNDEDFGSGGIPKPPGGGNYNYISEGRKSNTPFTAETADFTVCADLEADNPNPGLSCTVFASPLFRKNLLLRVAVQESRPANCLRNRAIVQVLCPIVRW